MNYTPQQGDIVYVDFDPSAGSEITKTRPALVISPQIFAEKTGLTMVCPITSTKRDTMLFVPLNGLKITGFILTHQLKSIDYKERNLKFIEKIDINIMKNVSNILITIIKT